MFKNTYLHRFVLLVLSQHFMYQYFRLGTFEGMKNED